MSRRAARLGAGDDPPCAPGPTAGGEAVAVAIITPDDLTRLTKGDRNAKQLEAEAKESPKPDTPVKEAPKPTPKAAAEPPPPPPPEPEVKPPEPAKAEPKPDPIAEKMAALAKEPPPPPEPAPGPTPEELKKQEEQRQAEEQKKKAEEAAKKKAADDLKQKQLADKKKREDDAKKKAIEDAKKKQKFDADNLAALLNKLPDKGAPAAAVDKSQTPSKAKGPVAGAPEGRDTRLTASEMSLLAMAIRQGVQPCWRVLGGGQGADATAVKMRIQFNQDGTLKSDPQIIGGQNSAFFMAAAESAKRAVLQCQPYNLPADKYAAWQDVILNFDPKDMF